jgi:hypothetical protein
LKRLICCAALLLAASTCFAAPQFNTQLSPSALRWFVVGACVFGAGIAMRYIRRKQAVSEAKAAALPQASTKNPEA